jgi:hypothetical protein
VTEKETFRLAPPVTFWWVWVAFVAVNVVDYAVQGVPSAHSGAVVAAVLLLVTGLAYTLALRPQVIASGDGITVRNPYRTHVVPWRLITLVDTGEWVQVRYAPVPDGAGAEGAAARGFAAAPGVAPSSAGDRTVRCWALYVSSRARRKIASGPPRARRQQGLLGLARVGLRGAGAGLGATPSSRLPEEARYLASLPPAKAIAVRLDTRANRERARPDNGETALAAVAWSWSALAAVIIPALILLAVALA